MIDISDDQLALELAALWQGRFAYDPRAKRWRVRQGDAWEIDTTRQHQSEAREILRKKAEALVAGARSLDRGALNRACHAGQQLRAAWQLRSVLSMARTDSRLIYAE